MLSDGLVARIALVTAVAGIVLIFLTDAAFEAKNVEIAEINEEVVGQKVAVKGKVVWENLKNNVLLYEITDGNSIMVVTFSPTLEEKALIKRNSFLKVQGKVQLYKDELEIVAERVEEWLK